MEIAGLSPLGEDEARMYAPLTLAYLGDGVYELFVRGYLASRGNLPVGKLHNCAKQFVRADAQSRLVDFIQEELTEKEADICRRGRNAKPHTTAKNMPAADYMKATGLEAVFGYLYLTGDFARLNFLFSKIIEKVEIA